MGSNRTAGTIFFLLSWSNSRLLSIYYNMNWCENDAISPHTLNSDLDYSDSRLFFHAVNNKLPINYSHHTIFLKREEVTTRNKTFLKIQPIRKDEPNKQILSIFYNRSHGCGHNACVFTHTHGLDSADFSNKSSYHV
jgi:hypothetical protein